MKVIDTGYQMFVCLYVRRLVLGFTYMQYVMLALVYKKKIGVGTMNRLFGSDILHTWVLGFVEAAVGFTLQIVKYIGHPNVDDRYSQSPKKLVEFIKRFPSHSSLQPMKKHVIFTNIYDLCHAANSKKKTIP